MSTGLIIGATSRDDTAKVERASGVLPECLGDLENQINALAEQVQRVECGLHRLVNPTPEAVAGKEVGVPPVPETVEARLMHANRMLHDLVDELAEQATRLENAV